MRRLLTVLMVLGLVGTACGDGEPVQPADSGAGKSSEVQPGSELVAAAGEEPAGAGAQESGEAEPVDGALAMDAEEMMPDELNVAYLMGRPTANQAARVDKTYDQALDLVVNWIPVASGSEMARAMEAGDVDISYSQDLVSFASSVTSGSALLLVGVAAVHADGIVGFDIISVSGAFAAEYPDIVTGFLQVTEDANAAYNVDRAPFIEIIAEAVGMDRDTTVALLDTRSFPEKEALLSEAWLGGTVQQVMREQMDSLVAQGGIDSALGSYDAFIDTRFLEAVN